MMQAEAWGGFTATRVPPRCPFQCRSPTRVPVIPTTVFDADAPHQPAFACGGGRILRELKGGHELFGVFELARDEHFGRARNLERRIRAYAVISGSSCYDQSDSRSAATLPKPSSAPESEAHEANSCSTSTSSHFDRT